MDQILDKAVSILPNSLAELVVGYLTIYDFCWSGKTLYRVIATDTAIPKAFFSDVSLPGAVFIRCAFQGRGAVHETPYTLRGTRAPHSLFVGCDVSKAAVFASNLSHSAFRNIIGSGAEFLDTDLSGADFRNASAVGAKFRYTNLSDANFTGADLTRAAFIHCDLRRTNFTGACLLSATIVGGAHASTIYTDADMSHVARELYAGFSRAREAVLKF